MFLVPYSWRFVVYLATTVYGTIVTFKVSARLLLFGERKLRTVLLNLLLKFIHAPIVHEEA